MFFAIEANGWCYAQTSLLQAPWSIESSYETTTDHFWYSKWSLRKQYYRSDLSYPFLSEGESGSGFLVEGDYQFGETSLNKFRLGSLKLGHINKISPVLKLEYGLGLSQLHESVSSRNQVAVPFWLLVERLWGKNESLWTQFKLSSGFTMDSMAWSSNDDVFMRAQQATLNSSWRLADRWRWNLRSYLGRLSDANMKLSLDSTLLYGFETTSPWIWFGWGVNVEHFSQNVVSYWSPDLVKGSGPVFEGNWELNEKWSINSELHFSLQKEDSYDWTSGYVVALGIQNGKRDKAHWNFNYLLIRSNQKSGHWQSNLFNGVYTF